jgi:hypothetical protein
MSNSAEPVRIAVLDDYQNVALSMADWSGLDKRAAITVFNDHIADPDAVVARLQSFDIVCVRGVARLVGIEGGVVSGVINLESSGVEAPDWRPRHDEHYHEA